MPGRPADEPVGLLIRIVLGMPRPWSPRAALVLIVGAAILTGAVQPAATDPGAAGPRRRSVPGMAYDAARREVVLFGGTDGARFIGDTWAWDGAVWEEMPPS
jgi:hypothetical protein